MQKTTVIIIVLVFVASLSIGINIGLTWNNQTPSNNNPSSTPTSDSQTTTPNTNTPIPYGTPSSTPSSGALNVSYTESGREEIGNDSKVTITVNATYLSGNDIRIDYSQFYLRLYAQRFIAQIPAGTTYPLNSGAFTIGISHQTSIFQLIFEFSSDSFNGMNTVGTSYNLEYNGTASINWVNQNYL
jgi:hypothetical protein